MTKQEIKLELAVACIGNPSGTFSLADIKDIYEWITEDTEKGIQPKQDKQILANSCKTCKEWSEEDKAKLNRINSILGQAADTHAYSTTCRLLIGD